MTTTSFLASAQALDGADPLAPFRSRFRLPEGMVYLDGNSLGAMPAALPAAMADVVQAQWGRGLVTSWNTADWVNLPRVVGKQIAALVGAAPNTVRATDSTSINLFKVLAAALALNPNRRGIVSEADTFPTDLYMAQGLLQMVGREADELRLVDGPAAIDQALQAQPAVLLLSHVNYRSGYLHDMATVTAKAHAAGTLVVWDLAHSAGAMPVGLDAAGADFAVGCGYKYLNGGPGAPAYVYVAERHHHAAVNPLSGWFGHAAPFAFDPQYSPAVGIDRFLSGTPPVLAMAALHTALNALDGVDMVAVRAKSLALGDWFLQCCEATLANHGLSCITPLDVAHRGSQLSFTHPHAYAICQALIARGVVGDFRTPNILRFGFTPLYLGYEDVARAAQALDAVMRNGEWQDARYTQRAAVT